MLRYLLAGWLLLPTLASLLAQPSLDITIGLDRLSDSTEFLVPDIQDEIEALMGAEYELRFQLIGMDETGFEDLLNSAYQSSDIIIGSGLEVSRYLSERTSFPKPTILSLVLDNEIQGLPITDEGSCGIENLTYVQSFFNIERDLATLYEIVPYEELIVLVDGSTSLERSFDLEAFLAKRSPNSSVRYTIVPIQGASTALSSVPTSSAAVFAFPLNRALSLSEQKSFYEGLADRGQLSFSLLSTPTMQIGGYAAYDTDTNLRRIPRRVALNVLKIVEGTPAAELPVRMQSFTENLLINFDAARRSGIYPNWDVLAEAILVNVNEVGNGQTPLNLEAAIAEGLEKNLDFSVAQRDVRTSELDIRVAQANYLPQLDVSASAAVLDEATVRNSFGTRGMFTANATASVSQLVLSEPAMANIAIQRLLLESSEQALRQSELDVVLDVSNAYLNILQAQELVRLRNENVLLTRKNLDIAEAKERVGYSGTSDVYRLQSELALDNIDLNNALASMRQARFGLNSLLNRPIDEEYPLADIEVQEEISLMVMDGRIASLIDNPGDAAILGDFFIEEAMANLPEIKQLEAAIAAQERSLLSQSRAFYLPQLVLTGEYNVPISNSGYPEGVMPIDVPNTYNAALSAQLPIFQGNSRRYQREQTQVDIYRLGDQITNLRNNLEVQIRANLENVYASFSRVQLSRIALEAARQSFAIAQDSYQQGLLNITSLLDAQNAQLQSDINATTAIYTFVVDYFSLERSIGYYHFLATPAQRDAYYSRFLQFLSNRQ